MPPRTRGASPATDIINGVIPNFNSSNNRTNLPYLTWKIASNLQNMFFWDMTLHH